MNLPKKAIAYIAFLFVSSVLIGIYLSNQYSIPSLKMLMFWALLSIVAESLAISLPNGVGVSVGLAISLAVIVTTGPLSAAITSAVSFTFRIAYVKGRGYIHLFNSPIYKTLFNISQGIVVTGAAGMVYIIFGGVVGSFSAIQTLLIIPVYVFLNSSIMALLFSFISGNKFSSIWIGSIRGVFLSAVAVGVVGIIIALAYFAFDWPAVLLFFAPLLLARYSFKLYVDMRNVYMETIQALNKTMEAKDPYTSGHALRVQKYAVELAEAIELPEKKIQNIKTAALLHDIGKIGIDDSILKKPGALTKEEYLEIQKHTSIGAEILKDVDFLKEIAQIIRYHHERFDGKGYPNGLLGEQIPIEASILAIADVFDAMTSHRPYRTALDEATALQEIKINAGKQFDPALAQKFCDMMSVRHAEGSLANGN